MRHFAPLLALLFICLLFPGCGRQEAQDDSWQGIQRETADLSTITDRTEYYDISVDSRQFASASSAGVFLGAQFYQGDPVELRMETLPGEDSPHQYCLCIYRMDGSREVLIPHLSLDPFSKCYLDQDGSCYGWVNSYTLQPSGQSHGQAVSTTLTKYLPSGEVLFAKEWAHEERILDIRQLADGSIYLILEDSEAQGKVLELDASTGETREVSEIPASSLGGGRYLGESGGSLAVYQSSIYGERDFVALDPADGSETFLLSLNGTSYLFPSNLALWDFQVSENGSVELLWAHIADPNQSTATLETLHMNKIQQTPVIMRGSAFPSWLLEQVNLFNQNSEKYHIVPEPCGAGNDGDDFARLTSVQLSAGKGPDILYGDFMRDYLWGMMAKGNLEDLGPFLESSGIRKDDYFSLVFSTWSDGGKIYGINAQCPYLVGYKTSQALLGNLAVPDAESIVDALLSKEEDLIYLRGHGPQALLHLFLAGSETLFGMVDWERGRCDFNSRLFGKLLETARRYGDDGRTRQDSYPTEEMSFLDIFGFDSQADLEKSGMLKTGVLFDDGCHAAIASTGTLAVNANSSVKEGAWEFISFLLSREVQSTLDYLPPIRKDAFDLWLARERGKVADGQSFGLSINYLEADGSITTVRKEYTQDDLTDEKVEEYKKALEEACPYPIRTVPILNIIREESEYYFNGSKSAQEVEAIITNRVQLYLDENL